MKILVLGSEGQIGKPVCNFLIRNGHEVIPIDLKKSRVHDLRFGINTHLHLAFALCDFVYYFASDVGGAKYLEKNQDSFDFIDDNIRIMRTVFGALKQYQKPFIFTSSQMAEQPDSTYGNLKLIGERYTKSLGGMFVRLWNVYGKEEDEDKSHVITDFIAQAKLGEIKCRTNGEEMRQFLHVDDFCECILALTDRYEELDKKESIDISSFEWTSIKDVAGICAVLFNCEVYFSNRKDQTQKNYKNDPKRNILKIWEPNVSIIDGIKKIFDD
jgi:nucleoside-diphosphate-sugar epimerase